MPVTFVELDADADASEQNGNVFEVASAFSGVVDVVTTDAGVQPLRLLAAQHRLAPQPLALMGEFTSGVRMRLTTAASVLGLEVAVERLVMAHLDAPARDAEFVAEIGGRVVARAIASPTSLVRERRDAPWLRESAAPARVELPLGRVSEPREVVVWFPADAGVVVCSVDADAPLAAAPPADGPLWVHHGSSISHGGNADDARETWPARVGRHLGIRWTNLGFGGNAQLDPMTALSIRETRADVVTLELGINVVGADAMRERAFASAAHGFLDLLRDRMPSTPIVVIGAFACPTVEHAPGPIRGGADGRITATPRPDEPTALTLARSRELLAELVERRDDPALGYLDGRELLGPSDAATLADGLHPDQSGLDLIAERFLDRARDSRTVLGAAFAAAAGL